MNSFKKYFATSALVFVLCFINTETAWAQTKFKAQNVFQTFGIIWSIEFISQTQIILSLKEGKIIVYDLNKKTQTMIEGGPESHVHGQGGLLDIMLHPNFKENQVLYFSYTKKVTGGYTTAIAQGKLQEDKIIELKDLFVANNPNNRGHHFGSRIEHDGQNLFFTVGDRGERDWAQDLSADQGKVHRISFDGSIPSDNPFVKDKKSRPSIWSYGHRNPQGLKYDTVTQILYVQEHGPRGGDEINVIKMGKNYGWPKATYGKEYSGLTISKNPLQPGIEAPLYHFTPSIAPSGLELFRNGKVKGFEGKLISGSLVLTHLNVLDISNKKKIKELRLFKSMSERVRDVKKGPDGYLYFSTDSGKIFKVFQ